METKDMAHMADVAARVARRCFEAAQSEAARTAAEDEDTKRTRRLVRTAALNDLLALVEQLQAHSVWVGLASPDQADAKASAVEVLQLMQSDATAARRCISRVYGHAEGTSEVVGKRIGYDARALLEGHKFTAPARYRLHLDLVRLSGLVLKAAERLTEELEVEAKKEALAESMAGHPAGKGKLPAAADAGTFEQAGVPNPFRTGAIEIHVDKLSPSPADMARDLSLAAARARREQPRRAG